MLFTPEAQRREVILAAVGRLQFDVVRFRLEQEYDVETELAVLPFETARVVTGSPAAIDALPRGNTRRTVDRDKRVVALFPANGPSGTGENATIASSSTRSVVTLERAVSIDFLSIQTNRMRRREREMVDRNTIPEFLSASEAADLLNVSEKTVLQMVEDGRLESLGYNTVRIRRQSLDQIVAGYREADCRAILAEIWRLRASTDTARGYTVYISPALSERIRKVLQNDA